MKATILMTHFVDNQWTTTRTCTFTLH